jgi:hypothetical protein
VSAPTTTGPSVGEASRPGTRAVLAHYAGAKAAPKTDSQARRARVLAHPDLAERLTEPPLGLRDPVQWSGWIPPRTMPEQACAACRSARSDPRRCRDPHRAPLNQSPIRRQLVSIASEALARVEPSRTRPGHGDRPSCRAPAGVA